MYNSYMMKKKHLGIAALSAACLFLGLLQQRCTPAHAKYTATSCKCGGMAFQLSNKLPSGNGNIANQAMANCYGWAEFVALNWPTDSGRGFGDPGDVGLVGWETYMSTDEIFLPNAQHPYPYGNHGPVMAGINKSKLQSGRYLILEENQKVNRGFTSNQVVLKGGPAWLGAQNGTNIWYEVLVNKVEYDYITGKGFYNARTQYDSCSNGSRIVLPAAGDGAIEVKSAWMEVKDTANAKWKRYKLSLAYVRDSTNGRYRETVVALIGMHILRKTANQPTFVWATFEQVDNVPEDSGSMAPYNLANPSCSAQTVKVKTRAGNDTTVTINCKPNVQPPYYLVHGNKPMPIQVSRETPYNSADNTAANQAAISCIQAAYPNSVWQYYRLIDVLWSTSPTQDNMQNATDSMRMTAMQPTGYMANATMETYNQKTSCAQTCHKFASIAKVPGISNAPKYMTDFSFVFGLAKTPAALKSKKK